MGRVDGKELRFAGGIDSSCDNVLFAGALLVEYAGVVLA